MIRSKYHQLSLKLDYINIKLGKNVSFFITMCKILRRYSHGLLRDN
jgi:hypothetical protein